MKILILVLLFLMGCSSDTNGTPFDVGEVVDMTIDDVADIGLDVPPDAFATQPRERIECVPNDEPVVCDRFSPPAGPLGPLFDGTKIDWDCLAERIELFIMWSEHSNVGEYPDLESLTPLKKAKYILMAREVNFNIEPIEYEPINPGLRHVDGLRNLKSGGLNIRNNVDLEDLDGLCNLRDVHYLTIEDCPKLKSLKGLRNIRTPGLVIEIANNPSIPPEEFACLRKAFAGTTYVIGRGSGTDVECPEGYWGEDTP